MCPFFSIVIPVYKAEKYIAKCIDSILSQFFPDWELLLIDDGSPDMSGKICDEYATKDKRIKVIHVENGGVSKARNIGLRNTKGAWVTFIDSDDWVEKTFLKVAYDEITSNHLDFFQLSVACITQDAITTVKKNESIVLNKKEYINGHYYLACIGGSFFQKSILDQKAICFNESIKYAEDQIFIMKYILSSSRMKRNSQCLYMYLQNMQSATHNSQDEGIIESMNALCRFKYANPVFTQHIDALLMYFLFYLITNNNISYLRIGQIFKSLEIKRNAYMSTIETQFVNNSRFSFLYACYFFKLRIIARNSRNFIYNRIL